MTKWILPSTETAMQQQVIKLRTDLENNFISERAAIVKRLIEIEKLISKD